MLLPRSRASSRLSPDELGNLDIPEEVQALVLVIQKVTRMQDLLSP